MKFIEAVLIRRPATRHIVCSVLSLALATRAKGAPGPSRPALPLPSHSSHAGVGSPSGYRNPTPRESSAADTKLLCGDQLVGLDVAHLLAESIDVHRVDLERRRVILPSVAARRRAAPWEAFQVIFCICRPHVEIAMRTTVND